MDNEFEKWFVTLNQLVFLPHKEMMRYAWEQAIQTSQATKYMTGTTHTIASITHTGVNT